MRREVNSGSPFLRRFEIGSFSFRLGVDFVLRDVGIDPFRLRFPFDMILLEPHLKSRRSSQSESLVPDSKEVERLLRKNRIEASTCVWVSR